MIQQMQDSFGIYLSKKRKERHVSLRKLAEYLGFSAPYLSDVERGHRNPLNLEAIKKVAEYLSLSKDEETQMFDAAARAGDTIATDIVEYIKHLYDILQALRLARDNNLPENSWLEFIERIKQNPHYGVIEHEK